MLTTVAISSAAPASNSDLAGLVIILLLIAFLIAKELASAAPNPRAQQLNRALNIGIVPLIFVFATIVASRLL